MSARLVNASDVSDPRSLSNTLRTRRFQRFVELTRDMPRPLSILDVGGTEQFWEQRGWAGLPDVRITLLNLEACECRHETIRGIAGDATDLSEFEDGSFDVAFSNSVIEHLFTWKNQQAMAREVRRVGRAYWVQTPNFWFPVEPHFLTPLWHWLPSSVRIALLRRRRFGQRGPCPDAEEARRMVEEIRLVTAREMRTLFPDGEIISEKFYGLVKSFVAWRPATGSRGERQE